MISSQQTSVELTEMIWNLQAQQVKNILLVIRKLGHKQLLFKMEVCTFQKT